ncbi:MAG: AmmeMemoRadiSam system radical SAM enzyme [Chloroflexota bacterium]|nr:AmmeMemoRadiSam system radical SAM enzyme [Chloroflexota bacterium]
MRKEATLYKKLKKSYVQCTACEHFCAIEPGGMGKCGIRRNYDGALYLMVYGQAAALHVDPIEKKPLYHFLPTRSILSLGTVGCNFQCQFCQNWSISQAGDKVEPGYAGGEQAMPEDLVSFCQRRNIPMLAYTYNEPAVFFEYACDTARLAHQNGIRNVFVSSGFESMDALMEIEPYLDAINIDLKAFNDRFYREVCGTRLAPVKRNIEHIVHHTDIWIEITTLLIPGLNDSEPELREMAAWLVSVSPDLPWHISAFHPAYKMLDRPRTPHGSLVRAWEIGKDAGLNYVYVGNVHDRDRESTLCPQCGERLISRSWYRVTAHWRRPGECHGCGARIPGIWV